MAKAKTEQLTVEDAIAEARARRAAATEGAVQEFIAAGTEAPPPVDEPVAEPVVEAPVAEENIDDIENRLDASFDALFAPTEPVDTEVKLDPDGTLSFNLEELPVSAEAAAKGPLSLSDELPPLPPADEPQDPDFEPELPVDWDRLSEATRLEIAAGRAALTKHGNPAR